METFIVVHEPKEKNRPGCRIFVTVVEASSAGAAANKCPTAPDQYYKKPVAHKAWNGSRGAAFAI